MTHPHRSRLSSTVVRAGRGRRGLIAAACGSALAVGLGTAVLPGSAAQAAAAPTITTTEVDVAMRDGVTLDTTISAPSNAGSGPFPVVIVPGTFAGDGVNADKMAELLAQRGYVTASYTERGEGDSTGEIDCGGGNDVNDASDVLNYVLAHEPGDVNRVGIASVSYGAGFLPMVILNDHRFKAMAMVSGWGDMWRSRVPNNTYANVANVALSAIGLAAGRMSQGCSDFSNGMVAGQDTPALRQYAAVRSPITYLAQLKQHNVPLYMSSSMNEMIWPEDQTTDFYGAYPGVKHIDLMPGDHATTELFMGDGDAGFTWLAAFDWMDKQVKAGPAAQEADPVRVAPRAGENYLSTNGLTTYRTESYPSVAAATAPFRRQYLRSDSAVLGLGANRSLAAVAGSASTRIRAGENLMMTNGLPMYEGAAEVLTGMPQTVNLALVDQGVTAVFPGPALTVAQKLRGAVKVHLSLTPSSSGAGSVFAYLLDEGPDGTTSMVGHVPYSWANGKAGQALTVDTVIPYQGYDLPAGHKLVAAVSTGDVLYQSRNPMLSTLSIGASSYFDVPVDKG